MNGNLCLTRVFRLLLVLIPVLIGLVFLPVNGNAKDEKNACRQAVQATCNACESLQVTMEELEKHPEDYYGKTVTVTGEMHRIFTDNVFTIEDSGFLRDHDILVISTAPREQVLTPANLSCNQCPSADSLDPGKDVTVTGVVQPYDRGKLECAYGPLNLESREGHSFTKNPVIIVDRPKATAMVTPPPEPVISAPEPAPPTPPAPQPEVIILPAPEPPPAPAPVVEEPKPSLPRTASNLPVLALVGLLAFSGALLKLKLEA
jgi:hypothetical protein